ncbi:hypothetical protein WA026_000020 [Henosepilachna vigintioctopunctata]|uniref:C2H2-type domain-containing protein n=1 Tax=Henosepilachna vigintioctopunctata TaxID=420089 RepID=A0AAW1V734_9CUCU
MNSENISCEKKTESEEYLDNKQISNRFNTNVFPNQDVPLKTSDCSEEKETLDIDYKNDLSKEQTGQIIANQSEFHEDCKSSKKELSNNNSSGPKIHIDKEDIGETEFLGGEVEGERISENPVNHIEIENYEDQENLSQFSEHESPVEYNFRSGTDSEHPIYIDLEENSENLGTLSEENPLDSNNSHKNKFSPSDDSQYDMNHLLDIKEVKVLHECSLCQYSSTSLGILQKHISTKHRGRKIWKCKHCSKKFSSKDSLHKHVYKDHKKRTRKCPFCLCILVCSGKVMKNHISDMHSLECLPPVRPDSNTLELDGFTRKGPRGTYKCKNCSYSNRCLNNMLTHAKLHTRKLLLKCLYCHYLTDQQYLYFSHLSNAHKLAKRIHVCSRCFFQSDDFVEYVEHHKQPHSYHSCEFCNFKTYSVEKFYSHIDNCGSNDPKNIENLEEQDENSEHSEKDEVMEEQHSKILGKGDVTEDEVTNNEVENGRKIKSLKEYYTQSKVNNLSIFSCLKCDFESKSNSIHEICEHLVKEHFICPKNSESPYSIKDTNVVEIIQVESENSPANRYMIEPRSTNAKTQHDNIKNSSYSCRHCGWVASTLHQKVNHEQKMHNVRNFNCPTCSFETTEESALIDHFKNHPDSNREILCCPFCELEMENETSLKSHVDIEHLNLIEECEEDNIKQKLLDDDLHKSSEETTSAANEVEFNEIYHCDLCSFNTQDLATFESHKKNHLILICPRCSLDQFSSEDEFWRHVDQHCPQCHFYSNDPKELKLHVLEHVPKYRRRKAEDSTNRSKRLLDADTVPVENVKFISDDETYSCGDIDELDEDSIQGEEIRIIFEDFSEEDDASEQYSSDNEETGVIEEINDDKIKSRSKRRRVKESASKNSNVEDKQYIGKPVRIIKLVQFQCFDCLNVYKTRYTLVDHRKRMHGLKKPHSCTYCMEIFENYSSLKSHYYRVHKMSFHYRGPIFKCPLCEFNSRYLKKTFEHVENVHKKRVLGFQKGTVVR